MGKATAQAPRKVIQSPCLPKGNRLAMQGDQHFTYDLLGRRIEKRWGKGQRFKQIYRYNANSQLALVQSQGEQTRFYWLGDSLIKEQHTSAAIGTQSTTYLFEPEQGNRESFKPVALVKSDLAHPQGMVYHIHTDHLGTPQEVSNEAGEVVWAAQYRAYGAVKRQLKVVGSDVSAEDRPGPSFTMNLRFMGQYFDQETGLHYNRHRYYDPECGQFTTQDPIGLMGGLNNYQYVPNPVSWVDPLGLCEEYASKLDVFSGTKKASEYLKKMGVSRNKRVQYLQSFEKGTVEFDYAGDDLHALRFYDNVVAKPEGQYLFEFFGNNINRSGLALPPNWNRMVYIKQFKIREGTPLIRGRAAAQFSEGSQYAGGADQIFVLEPWKNYSLIDVSK